MPYGHQGRGAGAVHELELKGADHRQEGEHPSAAGECLQVKDQRVGLPMVLQN